MWKHKKMKNTFNSIVGKSGKFVIYGETARGQMRFYEFKSWQEAKAIGWKKVG